MALKGAFPAVFALFISFLLLFGCPQDYSSAANNGTGFPEPPEPPIGAKTPAKNTDGAPSVPAKQLPVNVSPLPQQQPAKKAFVPLADVSNYPAANANQKLIKEVVGSFDSNDDSTLNGVSKISKLGPAAIDDILPLLKEKNVYAQWAGLEVLSATLPIANSAQKEKANAALLPLLESKTAGARVLSAYLLLYFGEKNAIPVLIDALGETNRLAASEPPAPICTVANEALERYTGQAFGFSCQVGKADAAGAKKWQDWWGANKDNLIYDAAQKKFIEG